MANQLNDADYSWFDAKEYQLQHRLDIAGWAEMLKMRVDSKKQYQNHVDSKSDIRERKQFWNEYCKSVSINGFLNNRKGPAAQRPPLTEITRELRQSSPEQLQRIVLWRFAMRGYRALLVNPWAKDEDLKKQFDQWLRKLRKEFRSPFKRRGRPAANVGVTEHHLGSWAFHSILAVFDLDFHSEVFAKKPLSRSALHKMIRPTNTQDDPAEWAKRARQLLKRVIDGQEFLAVQSQSGAE
jgi:hypothetical protein